MRKVRPAFWKIGELDGFNSKTVRNFNLDDAVVYRYESEVDDHLKLRQQRVTRWMIAYRLASGK